VLRSPVETAEQSRRSDSKFLRIPFANDSYLMAKIRKFADFWAIREFVYIRKSPAGWQG
jgi:hypothetical protein